MNKCHICGTERKQIGTFDMTLGNEESIKDIPCYNISLTTFMKGKSICEKCMDTYYKIYALEFDKDFVCGGRKYFADGRNLE